MYFSECSGHKWKMHWEMWLPVNHKWPSGLRAGAAPCGGDGLSRKLLPPPCRAPFSELSIAVASITHCRFSFSFFFFTSWRLITLQYCSGFCHTLTWISHGFTWIPHPDPPSHLPLSFLNRCNLLTIVSPLFRCPGQQPELCSQSCVHTCVCKCRAFSAPKAALHH